MKLNLKTKCPCCDSKDIHTMGMDQFCLDCDWDNSLALVQSGDFENQILELELEAQQIAEIGNDSLSTFRTTKKSHSA